MTSVVRKKVSAGYFTVPVFYRLYVLSISWLLIRTPCCFILRRNFLPSFSQIGRSARLSEKRLLTLTVFAAAAADDDDDDDDDDQYYYDNDDNDDDAHDDYVRPNCILMVI